MRSVRHSLRFVRPFVALVLCVLASLVFVGGAGATDGVTGVTPPPSSCTISWNNASGGDWNTSSNWNPIAIPTSTDDVCVTLNGTYTVTTPVASGTPVTIHSLTLGGTSGTQTLQDLGTCSINQVLTTTTGTTVGANGVLQLTSVGCGTQSTLVGPVTNGGVLKTDIGAGGLRFISGNLTNNGSMPVNATTEFNANATTLTNAGTVTVADTMFLEVLNGASFTNNSGTIGAASPTGTGQVYESGGTFTENGGATTGAAPVLVDNNGTFGFLTYTGTGASTIALQGVTNYLAGNLGSAQTLNIECNGSRNTDVYAGASFTNAGAINLTNTDSAATQSQLFVVFGTLTNSGTINSVIASPATGGTRTIQGNLTNTGTLNVNATTSYNASSTLLDNHGTVAVADGMSLNVISGASFTNTSGTIGAKTLTGTGQIYESAGTFTQNAGTTIGAFPVLIDNNNGNIPGFLDYTGTGASTIAMEGVSNYLFGNLGSAQTLNIDSNCGRNTYVYAGSFTNAGAINLSNNDSCGNQSYLYALTGTLTNSGTITSQVLAPATSGSRLLQGNLTNSGTIQINTNTSDSWSSPIIQNTGTIGIADGITFSVPNTPVFTNAVNGLIKASGISTTGLMYLGQIGVGGSGGSFNSNGGKTSGVKPVVIDDGQLDFTAGGASVFGVRGSSKLTGNPGAGQSINIESTCSEHAVTTSQGSFTNSGTIQFTNADACGNNATLTINISGTGTLTNLGTVNALAAIGGTRTIQGSLSNKKTLFVDSGKTLLVTGSFSQTSLGTYTSAITSNTSIGLLSSLGPATIAGTVSTSRLPSFIPTVGSPFTILTGSSLTGTFSKETKGNINTTGLYFLPTYSSTSVILVVHQATAIIPATGTHGSPITVTGTGWESNDNLQVSFTDHVGVKTTYTAFFADATGAFSTSPTIPATAALGVGHVTVTSLLTGGLFTGNITIN